MFLSIPEDPRTLTFEELQSLIEQGKMDEIPNNKHIPDTINVLLISYSILSCLAHNAHDRRPYPASRAPHNAKSLGRSHRIRNDVRSPRLESWRQEDMPYRIRTLQVLHDQFDLYIALVHRTNFRRSPKIGLESIIFLLISKIPLFSFARQP